MNNSLRDAITNAYRMDEETCVNQLIPKATLPKAMLGPILDTAKKLVTETRAYKKKQGKLDSLLHQYDLSTEEGIALMCMAEALLRIPDTATMDKFVSDKLSTAEWKNHLSRENPLFINAATMSLMLTGTVYAPQLSNDASLASVFKRAFSRLGITVIRPILLQMMKAIGNQFVTGQTIDEALANAPALEKMGYRFSYDMLGEAARTPEDAKHYYAAYVTAIDAIGKTAKGQSPADNPGISVKLSALHPRYDYFKHDQVLAEVTPQLLALAKQAKQYNIGLTVDAEEADRLDLSLDIIEAVFTNDALNGYEGFGLAVQAYQKRAPFVIDWLADLSKRQGRRLMVRLVKGAYWDAEIKQSQIQGFEGYPVYTRKNTTDVAYIACARKLLSQPECFFPQFGTHNAYSTAAVMAIADEHQAPFEFQCLHGMGRPLYDQVVDKAQYARPCRIYAPVGSHRDLLGYLVRRLLENGANSSFVNQLSDENTPVDKIVFDPVARISALESKPHPRIPLPVNIYKQWKNSHGFDLSNPKDMLKLETSIQSLIAKQPWVAAPIVNGKVLTKANAETVVSPITSKKVLGQVSKAEAADVDQALAAAHQAMNTWGRTSVEERAVILERIADALEKQATEFAALLNQEAGKCLFDCLSEIREAIDFCRYYAHRARLDLNPVELPGPTGESNVFSLHPRGVMACISPWNFPLAIFTGQIVAALATGNPVITKPSEQTPMVAFKAVQLMHEAGVPKEALHLLIGQGSVVGAKLTSDPRVAGVLFTGSTETAKLIEKSLANRNGPIGLLVAETGGQNAMIVDSSALAEQAVVDIALSAFNSAGQRCSALRVLFVQDDIADKLLTMLKGYMGELTVSDPSFITTDIGPVIDEDALNMLKAHRERMVKEAALLAEIPLSNAPDGNFFSPCLFELKSIDQLTGEVFGPVLHVIRYKANELDKVIDSISSTGFGLTFGIHSRIDATVDYVTNRMPVGNLYVNRNMIGAVVGVQPFGGQGLSGTGPKAGGPHFLPRLCVERTVSVNTTAVGGNARLVSLSE
ncbi:MAG TPA: bifunctional proline dehydrogenase/L-glutamate gamma-semialdehyde dehydrogenase PutA [Gammaproteobacteria bacterium]|jgi:RHH-type proline utilization regulon transcriptional repressor/proline dehydrogenase/delta 1-pyrroline-5-carboxylate dehydrogenase|nr:bifunctional proline dehydrogenase/L-glutamate gamma-semialdehyde dehydrogenase PutA [Gammaproteobacteria bacterium]